MQAGIGGRTIEEAAERLSWEEIEVWRLYLHKWGRLHVGMRLETEFARLRQLVLAVASGKDSPPLSDMMAHPPRDELEEQTDNSFASLQRLAAGLMKKG